MRRTIVFAAACLGASLAAACNVTTSGVRDVAKQVQDYTASVCKFVPYTSDVLKLWDASAGVGATVESVGGTICSVVKNMPLADGPAQFRIRGVMVRGKFVR